MAQDLIEKFKEVNELYELALPLAQKAFEELKVENREQVEELNQSLSFVAFELKNKLTLLTDTIESKCESYQIDKKITILVEKFHVAEKEKILEALQQAMHYEREWQKSLMMYRCLAEAKMETIETILEVWRYEAQEEGSKNRLINKKL
ncbi:hypothetical protein CN918_27610 [Priestia megaterium]|nr:hypothetical protein CN918_27610 [Priestia megaterium]